MPGRKTDVLDCQWLQQLHTYGLLSASPRSEAEIRWLRSYLRQRSMLVRYASQHIQHIQKVLSQMNVKLRHVISDVTGNTGLAIIGDIVRGERHPHKLAQHHDPWIREDQEAIQRSPQRHWREEHIFKQAQKADLYRIYQCKIAQSDERIEAILEQFEQAVEGPPTARPGPIKKQKNSPAVDLCAHLYRITGVDAYTALKVNGEICTDMSKWPSAKHFASWLGLSPANRVTGGRIVNSRTNRNANRATAALRLADWTRLNYGMI